MDVPYRNKQSYKLCMSCSWFLSLVFIFSPNGLKECGIGLILSFLDNYNDHNGVIEGQTIYVTRQANLCLRAFRHDKF